MKKLFFLFSIISLSLFTNIDYVDAQTQEQVNSRVDAEKRKSLQNPDKAIVLILSNTEWTGAIEDSDGDYISKSGGSGMTSFMFDCVRGGSFGVEFGMLSPDGGMDVGVYQNGVLVDQGETSAPFGVVVLTDRCYHPAQASPSQSSPSGSSGGDSSGGGCLIATATYGSELAPQVQQLRELRDNKLLQTESGSAFMASFNDFYYSFSPNIADFERENPVFKEVVKIVITPMISSLSILNHVSMETDAEVLGYGISLILLNVGMYFGVPAIVIVKLKQKL
jgi:hypothetical protein